MHKENEYKYLFAMLCIGLLLISLFWYTWVEHSLFGNDIWRELTLSENIVNYNTLTINHNDFPMWWEAYNYWPAIHLVVGAISLVLNIPVEITVKIVILVLVALQLFLIYASMSKLFEKRIGLVSAFLFFISGANMRFSFEIIPATLGKIILLLIIYSIILYIKDNGSHRIKLFLITHILFFALLFTHRLSTIMSLFIIIPPIFLENKRLGILSWTITSTISLIFTYLFFKQYLLLILTLQVSLIVVTTIIYIFKDKLISISEYILNKKTYLPLFILVVGVGCIIFINYIANTYFLVKIPMSLNLIFYGSWSFILSTLLLCGAFSIKKIRSNSSALFILYLSIMSIIFTSLALIPQTKDFVYGLRILDFSIILLIPLSSFGIIYIDESLKKHGGYRLIILSSILIIAFSSSLEYSFFSQSVGFHEFFSEDKTYLPEWLSVNLPKNAYLHTPPYSWARYFNLYYMGLPVREIYSASGLEKIIVNDKIPLPYAGKYFKNTPRNVVISYIVFQNDQTTRDSVTDQVYISILENTNTVSKIAVIGGNKIYRIEGTKVVE